MRPKREGGVTAPRAPKTSRVWRLTARDGSNCFFEVTLPLDEAPDWDPPLAFDGGRFQWEHYAPLELYLDGKLAVTGATWADVLGEAAAKLRRARAR